MIGIARRNSEIDSLNNPILNKVISVASRKFEQKVYLKNGSTCGGNLKILLI